MKNIVATNLAVLYKFVIGYLTILLMWMLMHQYAYFAWTVVLGVPAFKSDPQT
jgi:hypothetical protein